jgi:urease accessory protein
MSAPASLLQRAKGALTVTLKRRGDETVLDDLRQDGCMKARFPRPVDWTEVVTLNSSGGVAGGDRVSAAFRVGAGGSATFASQAAERFYRALPEDPPAHVRTALRVEAGASAEWLPQESILFESCALDRVLDVDMAEDGWFLGVETLVFGRTAMGERIDTARLRDVIRVRQGGRLRLHDIIRIEGDVAPALARAAVLGGRAAVATMVHVAPDLAARIDALRDALAPFEAGVSAWDGMLVARIVAADGACIRSAIMAGLATLRAGRALPRVWNC